MKKKSNKFEIILFLILTFGSMLILNSFYTGNNDSILSLLMLTPFLSVLITKIVTKGSWNRNYLKPKIKKDINIYIFSWIGIIGIAFVGSLVYFIIFKNSFFPLNSRFALENHLTNLYEYLQKFLILIPIAIVVNPLFGLLFCFGEEVAWRGFLLPKMEILLGKVKASVVVSLFWGTWHAPIIWKGFNYGLEKSYLAIGAQLILCLSFGIVLSYLLYKSNTIWVPVVAHASLNAIDKFTPSYLFMSVNKVDTSMLGPNLTGIIGGIGLTILAMIFLLRMKKIQ